MLRSETRSATYLRIQIAVNLPASASVFRVVSRTPKRPIVAPLLLQCTVNPDVCQQNTVCMPYFALTQETHRLGERNTLDLRKELV